MWWVPSLTPSQTVSHFFHFSPLAPSVSPPPRVTQVTSSAARCLPITQSIPLCYVCSLHFLSARDICSCGFYISDLSTDCYVCVCVRACVHAALSLCVFCVCDCRYLLHCLRSLWVYLTGRAVSRTCSASRSSTELPRMQRASTPRYMHAHLQSACTYAQTNKHTNHAPHPKSKLHLLFLRSALDLSCLAACLWDWRVMPAVCLGCQRVNKSCMETGMSPWQPLMRFIGPE